MKKIWMLGLFGGAALSLTSSGFGEGTVTTQIKNIEIGGQVRSRFDYRRPDSYSNQVARNRRESDDTHWLRTRLHAKLDVGEGVTAMVNLQDAHVSGTTPVGTDDAGVTLHEGYINIEDFFGMPVDALVGRFAMNYGDGRLVSELDWSNSARHWDGARLRWNTNEQSWVDLAYTELQNGDLNNSNSVFRRADDDFDLYMLWAHYNLTNEFSIDAYALLEHDGTSDRGGEVVGVSSITSKDMDRWTYGALVKYDNQTFYASAEYDWQRGDIGFDDIKAYAFAGVAGYRLGDAMKTSFEYEYIYASGDKDGADGNVNTFVAPFPFAHKYHGIADLVGFSNSIDHNVKLKMSPTEKTQVTLAHHWFQRADRDDSWYAANGAVLRDGKGTISTLPQDAHELGVSGSNEIGQELDVIVDYNYTKFLKFELGYAHFFEGKFVRETDSAGDLDFYYLQTTLKF